MSDPLGKAPPPPPPPPLPVSSIVQNTFALPADGGGSKTGGPLRSVTSPNTIASVHKGVMERSTMAIMGKTSQTAGGNISLGVSRAPLNVSVPRGADPLSVPIPLVSKRQLSPNAPLKVPVGSSPSTPKKESNKVKATTPTSTTRPSISNNKMSPNNNPSPDADVDSFLSGPSNRTLASEETGPGQLPLLKPSALPSNLSGIQKLEELARRRAWADVLRLSTELLHGSLSPFQKYYSQLVHHGNEDDNDGSSAYSELDQDSNSNLNKQSHQTIKNTVRIIHLRLRAFVYLRRFNELKLEIVRLRLLPSHADTLPKWIPLSLILEGMECCDFYTNATAANHDDDSHSNATEDELDDILDNLYSLRNACSRKIAIEKEREENNKKTVIEKDGISDLFGVNKLYSLFKIDLVLCNILTRREEWRLALKCLDDILEYVYDAVKNWAYKKKIGSSGFNNSGIDNFSMSRAGADIEMLVKAVRVEIYSRQGKILLQAGALPAAATVFERAHDEYQAMIEMQEENLGTDGDFSQLRFGKESIVRNVPTQILLNEGLLHFAHLDYDLAMGKFQMAIEIQRKEIAKSAASANNRSRLYDFDNILDTEGELLVPCLNNLALSTLYSCRMRQAVDLMEGLVREDPGRYLTPSMAFNLCTLYELGSDNAASDKKKKVLQLIAKRFSLHDIGSESFRLS